VTSTDSGPTVFYRWQKEFFAERDRKLYEARKQRKIEQRATIEQ
jgi:hypothetical protein